MFYFHSYLGKWSINLNSLKPPSRLCFDVIISCAYLFHRASDTCILTLWTSGPNLNIYNSEDSTTTLGCHLHIGILSLKPSGKSPWKWTIGRLLSFWDNLFSGVMLVSGSVNHGIFHGLFISLSFSSVRPKKDPAVRSKGLHVWARHCLTDFHRWMRKMTRFSWTGRCLVGAWIKGPVDSNSGQLVWNIAT